MLFSLKQEAPVSIGGSTFTLLEKFVELYPEFEETVYKDAYALMNEYKDEFEV